MSISNTLNRLLKIDPGCITSLFLNTSSCNEEMSNNAYSIPISENGYILRTIGLLNTILEENNLPTIVMVFDDNNNEVISRFEERQRE